MRGTLAAVAVALCVGALAACGDDDDKAETGKSKTAVYFGWLLGGSELAAVAIEVDPADAQGRSKIRAYVCDGRSEPEGKAVWFAGPLALKATTSRAENASLTSAGGDETLVLEYVSTGRIQGSFTDDAGKRSQFMAYPAIDGAGIYEVTLDENLRYKGTSTDGNTLDATAQKDGLTQGTIKTASGDEVEFAVQSLALATPAQLRERGLADDYGKYKRFNQVPGEYTAVIAPGGSHWLGRSGNVRGGSTGVNIIGLDKKC